MGGCSRRLGPEFLLFCLLAIDKSKRKKVISEMPFEIDS
jgi:hypothetical protein